MIIPFSLYNDSILGINYKKIDISDSTIYSFINDMFDSMSLLSNSIGLAAHQIGNPLRIFVINTSRLSKRYRFDENKSKRVFINTEIVKIFGKTWISKEGCLSFPSFIEKIERYEFILVRYYNESLEKCEEKFQGLSARLIHHELFHMGGKLLIELKKDGFLEILNKKDWFFPFHILSKYLFFLFYFFDNSLKSFWMM